MTLKSTLIALMFLAIIGNAIAIDLGQYHYVYKVNSGNKIYSDSWINARFDYLDPQYNMHQSNITVSQSNYYYVQAPGYIGVKSGSITVR